MELGHGEVTTLTEYEARTSGPHGIIVVGDAARSQPIAHGWDCVHLTSEAFEEKLLANGNANGRYWWATILRSAPG